MSHPFAARIDAIPSQVIAHVAHQHKATERLLHLDLALSKAASIRTALLADAVPSLLASRSVATFRSAFEVTLRGQLYESALMVRAIVECAGYCLVAAVKPGASAAWQLRERGPAELKAGRVTFSPEQCRIAIQDHVPEAVDQFNSLYEESIAFGAHPNSAGVLSMTRTYSHDLQIRVEAMEFTDDPGQITEGLGRVEAAGVVALQLLMYALQPYTRDLDLPALAAKSISLFTNSPIAGPKNATNQRAQRNLPPTPTQGTDSVR